jgi:hypothetical protein
MTIVVIGSIVAASALTLYRSYFLAWRIRLLEAQFDELKSLCIALVRDNIAGDNARCTSVIASLRLVNLAVASHGSGADADEARARLEETVSLEPAFGQTLTLLKAKTAAEMLRYGLSEFPDRRLDRRLFE